MPGTDQIDRRSFFTVAGAATAAAAVFSQPRSTADEHTQPGKPNIVFIMADDLGWADVGYHGSKIQTPNIDLLAAEGVRFDQHYVAPTCTPTRVGLFTGRYPSRFGVVSPAYGDIFDPDTATLAGVLADNGYFTAISGKWHMGSPPNCVPRKYGFDSSYGYFHGQIDPYTHLYKTGVKSWHRNDELIHEEGHATDLITDEAVRVIEEKQDVPFFLYVAYSVPHYPLDEPDKWTEPYRDVFDNESRRWYAASVTHMDAGIGRIVKALEDTKQRRETLVVFVSDNGGQKSWHNEKYYKGRYADKPHEILGDNRPLRGWKGQVYEGGIRVPAVANWPGALKPGSVKAPVHIVDWMPTLLGLAQARANKEFHPDGRDVWPLIRTCAKSAPTRDLYWKTPGARAVRHGNWKLILGAKNGRCELYNIAADPYEEQDLADEKADVVSRLRKRIERIQERDRERR